MELRYGTQIITPATDETVLQALTRQGVALRSSCRGGVCQTCVMRCLEGEIPGRAQSGLSTDLISQRYFMPCVCKPSGDMVLAPPLADDFFVPAQLEQRLDDERGIMFMFEPMRTLPTSILAVIVRDSWGHKARFSLATRPDVDFYFGIHLPAYDVSELAEQWRQSLQVGMQIDMREALPSEDIAQLPASDRPKDPPPDPELWEALGEGALMTPILEDFYTRVYADPQLMSFFSGVTRQRLVEKQYSFLHQAITGNKVYFGNRPRNTHHWMVISDALMDHREQLMLDCMRAHGLAEKWVERWRLIEEYYRPDIVKSAPVPRRVDGVDLPLEGFEELVIDVGSICDGCGSVLEPGETVRYHVRRGTIYCSRCNTRVPANPQASSPDESL
ncbi:MAG: 2Fe-2S iron-sulfur cluster-binding protein [Gallionella sp.]|nr:2Fe-2S iron-sulfur cluster-binding protein [Gallionella sp.]